MQWLWVCKTAVQVHRNNWDKFHGKDWIPPPFPYKIPRFPFRKKKTTLPSFKANVLFKGHFSFLQGRKGIKSSHFMALSPFCITNHCTAIPHPELGHYSFHGFGLWQNRFLSKNHQKYLYKTKRLLTTKKKATCNS